MQKKHVCGILVWLQAETVAALRADVERLTSELKASETDRSSMKDELNELNRELAILRKPTSSSNSTSGVETPSLTDSQVEVPYIGITMSGAWRGDGLKAGTSGANEAARAKPGARTPTLKPRLHDEARCKLKYWQSKI